MTLIAPQQPKKATKKMMHPTTLRNTGVLKKLSPRKSRYSLNIFVKGIFRNFMRRTNLYCALTKESKFFFSSATDFIGEKKVIFLWQTRTIFNIHISLRGGLGFGFDKRIELLPQTLKFSDPYICATWWCRPLTFQSKIFWSNIYSIVGEDDFQLRDIWMRQGSSSRPCPRQLIINYFHKSNRYSFLKLVNKDICTKLHCYWA